MEKDTRYQPLDKASISADQISRPSVSYWKDAWRRFRKDKLAVFGLVMILIVSLFAIFGPMFCPYAYDEADFFSIAQWPSKAHWFGTDALGRDLYVRVLYGARISLSIGVVAALVNMVIGVLYGGIAGYFGGKVDNVMMRIVDIIIALPSLLYTILLMIPLQIAMIGLQWQMFVVVAIVTLLLVAGWRKLGHYDLRQDWKSILLYAVVVFALTQGLYALTALLFGESGGIHIEVLLPAFVLGMTMRHRHVDSAAEARASSFVSFLFMFLVGVSMPLFIGVQHAEALSGHHSVTGSQPMMSWGTIAVHVLIVSLLSNLGKLFPVFFYRDRKLSERLALSIGMFTRGEVGAGVIFIALGYNLGGPVLIVSVLTIVLNLILTGGFVLLVKRLALKAYGTQPS